MGYQNPGIAGKRLRLQLRIYARRLLNGDGSGSLRPDALISCEFARLHQIRLGADFIKTYRVRQELYERRREGTK